MKRAWKYIDESSYLRMKEEGNARYGHLCSLPDVYRNSFDIYVVAETGVIADKDGVFCSLEAGEEIKLLGDEVHQNKDWVYKCVRLSVSMAGGVIRIKEGARIAVLPTDWKDQHAELENEKPRRS